MPDEKPEFSEFIIRRDIPLVKPRVDRKYGPAIKILEPGDSLEIENHYQNAVIRHVKNLYPERVFATSTIEGKLYLQRLQ